MVATIPETLVKVHGEWHTPVYSEMHVQTQQEQSTGELA